MKIKLRKATALSVAIFAQERLEVPMDCFSIWTNVDEESHEGDKPIGTIQTNENNHVNLNSNEVHEIYDATNSRQNNPKETRRTSTGMV